jgi:hypothetical protein
MFKQLRARIFGRSKPVKPITLDDLEEKLVELPTFEEFEVLVNQTPLTEYEIALDKVSEEHRGSIELLQRDNELRKALFKVKVHTRLVKLKGAEEKDFRSKMSNLLKKYDEKSDAKLQENIGKLTDRYLKKMGKA